MKESIKLLYDIGRLNSDQFYDYLVNKPDLNFGFWVPILSFNNIDCSILLLYCRPSKNREIKSLGAFSIWYRNTLWSFSFHFCQ